MKKILQTFEKVGGVFYLKAKMLAVAIGFLFCFSGTANAQTNPFFVTPPCEFVVNGAFSNQLHWTGWASGWNIVGGRARNQANNVSGSSLNQTVTGLSNGNLKLSFQLGALNIASPSGNATLVVRIGGTTYATFTNTVGSNIISTTTANGAIISWAGITAPNGSYAHTDVELIIPYSGQTSNYLHFVFSAVGNNAEDFELDNVSLEASSCVQPPVCDPLKSFSPFNPNNTPLANQYTVNQSNGLNISYDNATNVVLYTNDNSNSLTINASAVSTDPDRPRLRATEESVTIVLGVASGTLSSNPAARTTTFTFASPVNDYIFSIIDLLTSNEMVRVTGYDNSGNVVYPIFTNFQRGAEVISINLLRDGTDGDGQGIADFYFPSPVKSITFYQEGTQNYVIYTVKTCQLYIQGNVFNDLNSNTIIDGGEEAPLIANQLRVYLKDVNGVIRDSAHVSAEGSYLLNYVQPNTSYTLHLSTQNYIIGTNSSVVVTPPTGWLRTGENGAGNTGLGDGTPDGILEVSVGTTDVTQQNFGLKESSSTPVTFVSFNAERSGADADLVWVTASEQNNRGFVVENSKDGIQWQSLGFVPSKAAHRNSSIRLAYDFKHLQPNAGKQFYRLKQVDNDGTKQYSSVRAFEFNSEEVSIYPNPTKENVTITGLNGYNKLSIYDMTGRLVKIIALHEDIVEVSLDSFPSGVYNLKVSNKEGIVESFRVVKD